MRSLLAFCCCLALAVAGDDPLASLRFADGVPRTAADFAGQNVVIYSFCGHCPNALGSLGRQVKQLADLLESERHPTWLVCATPNLEEPAKLLQLAKEKGLTTVLMAYDPANRRNISLQNVYQVDVLNPSGVLVPGRWDDLAGSVAKVETATPGAYRLPIDGLTDDKIRAAWWALERGRPGALKELVAAAKQKTLYQAQAQKVVDAAKAAFDDALAKAGDGFAAYETIERLAARFDGLDVKPAKTRLGELGKDAQVKKELKARAAWLECQRLLASPKPREQAAGRDGLAQLAKTMPDTIYGAKAANAK